MNQDPDRLKRLADAEDGCPIGVGGINVFTFDELQRKIMEILPQAQLDEDNYGQIVIYTDMKTIVDEQGRHVVVPFVNEEEE